MVIVKRWLLLNSKKQKIFRLQSFSFRFIVKLESKNQELKCFNLNSGFRGRYFRWWWGRCSDLVRVVLYCLLMLLVKIQIEKSQLLDLILKFTIYLTENECERKICIVKSIVSVVIMKKRFQYRLINIRRPHLKNLLQSQTCFLLKTLVTNVEK